MCIISMYIHKQELFAAGKMAYIEVNEVLTWTLLTYNGIQDGGSIFGLSASVVGTLLLRALNLLRATSSSEKSGESSNMDKI
jgi:hypothetical protein